jgi:sulfite exporter TauE/SafE
MSANIGKRVRSYMVFFVILILFLIWGDTIVGVVTATISGDKDKAELAQKVIASVITAIGGLALIIINLGRDINLHNFVDKSLFRVRRKTDRLIRAEMIEAAKAVEANGWWNMESKGKEVSRLFYHFANQQEALRNLAFTYWEQYFVNIYILCFAFVGFVVSGVIVILRHRLDFTILSPVVFCLILIAIGLSTRFSLVKRIYDLPAQQIDEIKSSNAAELRTQVQSRFGGATT